MSVAVRKQQGEAGKASAYASSKLMADDQLSPSVAAISASDTAASSLAGQQIPAPGLGAPGTDHGRLATQAESDPLAKAPKAPRQQVAARSLAKTPLTTTTPRSTPVFRESPRESSRTSFITSTRNVQLEGGPSSPSSDESSSSGTTVGYRTPGDGGIPKPEPISSQEESDLLHTENESQSVEGAAILRTKVESPSSEEEFAVLRAVASSPSPQTAPQSPQDIFDDVPTPRAMPPYKPVESGYTSRGSRRAAAHAIDSQPRVRDNQPSSGPSSPGPHASKSARRAHKAEV